MVQYRIGYRLAEGHGSHIAIQILYFGDSWITPWPDFHEWEDHLRLFAFLPFLKIVGPLTRRYFKQLTFTCLIRRCLFCIWHTRMCQIWCVCIVRPLEPRPCFSHHSYKKLAHIKTPGLPAESQWVNINEGKTLFRNANNAAETIHCRHLHISPLSFLDLFS